MATFSAQQYVDLLGSQYKSQPRYSAWVAALVQPLVDNITLLQSLPAAFSLATAVGVQLDVVGQYVGASRVVDLPGNLYASLDTPGLGLDEGIIYSSATAITGSILLDDDHYRLLLQAKVLNNHWDGSIPKAYELWDKVTQGGPYQFFMVDYEDMHMAIGLVSLTLPIDVVTQALLTSGKLDVKPGGVGTEYIIPTAPGPIAALDMDTPFFKGLDEGVLATFTSG